MPEGKAADNTPPGARPAESKPGDAKPRDPAKPPGSVPGAGAASPQSGVSQGGAARPSGPRGNPPPPAGQSPGQSPGGSRAPQDARPSTAARPSRSALAVLTALAVVLLAGGVVWLWVQQQEILARSADRAAVTLLGDQVRTLQQRLAQLEQRPTPSPAPAAPAVDLRPLEQRLAALEQRPAPEPAAPAGPDPALSKRIAELDQRVAQAEQAATARAASLARLQRAALALDRGVPIGEIPDAPGALSRFAAAAPPTEAALRLSFPDAAERALAASRPEGDVQGMADRVWQRVRSLVTVREGGRVLLGAPAAVVLRAAEEKLDAGDLAGAVAELQALDPPAAAAMADWREQAASLLAAREALSTMLAR